MKKTGLFCIIVALICGCSTKTEKLARHGTIIPQPEGIYVASGSHKNAETAFQIALASAEICCKEQGKRHIVLDTKVNEEEGLLEETPAKILDIATGIAGPFGGFIPVNGNTFRGKKYVQITYRCEQ